MSLSIRPTRASNSLPVRLVLALGIFLLLQPGLLAVLGTSKMPLVTPRHQHVSAGAVPEHQHWYDTQDQSKVPPGCGLNHHDHPADRAEGASVVCVEGDDVAGQHGGSALIGPDGLVLGRRAVEQQIPLPTSIIFASWIGRPSTPPPQLLL